MKKKYLKLQITRETLLNLVPAEDWGKIQGGTSFLCSQSCDVACLMTQYTKTQHCA